jgi:peptide/nickel transport system permease protein
MRSMPATEPTPLAFALLGLLKRAAARIGWALVVVWAVVTVTFALNEVIPSDPARMVTGPQARPQEVARVREQLGLDRPVVARYAIFVRRLVHLAPSTADARAAEAHASCASAGPLHIDLGRSFVQRRPVVAIIAERLPRSAALAAAAVLVQMLIGVALGTFAAAKRGTRWDASATIATLIAGSAPTFLVGIALQYVLGYKLGWLPLDGFGTTPAAQARALVMPAIALGIFGAAYATRLVRDEVNAALALDHARTARAKGASRVGVLVRHALRNALAPVFTLAGLDFGALVGGAIVVETLFRWPGLGAVSVNALLDRDGPVILGTVLVTSTGIVLTNVVVDLLFPLLDPRGRSA